MNRDLSRRVAAALLTSALFAGCTTPEKSATNLNQPGPAIGVVVGSAAGAVVGQTVGAGVAATQGAANAIHAPFNNEHRIVRTWKTETTADGRTIQVPVDTEVDEYGRPLAK